MSNNSWRMKAKSFGCKSVTNDKKLYNRSCNPSFTNRDKYGFKKLSPIALKNQLKMELREYIRVVESVINARSGNKSLIGSVPDEAYINNLKAFRKSMQCVLQNINSLSKTQLCMQRTGIRKYAKRYNIQYLISTFKWPFNQNLKPVYVQAINKKPVKVVTTIVSVDLSGEKQVVKQEQHYTFMPYIQPKEYVFNDWNPCSGNYSEKECNKFPSSCYWDSNNDYCEERSAVGSLTYGIGSALSGASSQLYNYINPDFSSGVDESLGSFY